ncbi:exported hypothetical protein [Parafrankia sp. Ea1.12]|uniref:hypothetical protein n=1 Tax=Parafrankia sp. Ea1.12 TaxID=573499 RepID=UPI000DA4889C|nr:hypothetical protein [Parafrankia sp. Ea1.12]SQD93971.1 exported hypothetical protein [Parafrankia sp. Ea1.12]
MRGIRNTAVVLGVLVMLAACSVKIRSDVKSGQAPGDVPATLAIPPDAAAPDTAGGLTRSRDTEAKIPDLLAQAREQLPADVVALSSITFAVYHQPGIDLPNGDILLVRGALTDPDTLLAAARSRPGQQGPPLDVDLGAGLRSVCTQSPDASGYLASVCVWVTADKFSEIRPLVPTTAPVAPPTTAELAELMQKLLPDLQ